MDYRPTTTIDEAVAALADLGSDAAVLAGGTDLMVQLMRGETAPPVAVGVGTIAELAGIDVDTEVRIGAATTQRALSRDPQLRRLVPALAQAAAQVGGWQTQAVATLGGNVCNASPAADTIPPLLLADTEVELRSHRGARRLALAEFILGRRATARQPDELVTGFRLQPLPPNATETYLKVAPRRAMEVAVVGLAVRLALTDDGEAVTSVGIAAGAVAARPFRATAAEEALVGGPLTAGRIDEAGALLAEQADPIDDYRASARYRRRLLPSLLKRALHSCRLAGGRR